MILATKLNFKATQNKTSALVHELAVFCFIFLLPVASALYQGKCLLCIQVMMSSLHHTQIDVGKCSGVCGVEEEMEMLGSGIGEAVLMATAMACQPTRAHSVAAEGPNGQSLCLSFKAPYISNIMIT